jgi:hypothetical protein
VIFNCFNELLRNNGAFLRYEENYLRRAMFKTFCSLLLSSLIYLNTSKAATGIAVVYDAARNAVSIKWQDKAGGIKTFVIQRSDNNRSWTDIAFLGAAEFSPGKQYQYFDKNPAPGQNYYRLKAVTSNNQTEYSISVMVITGEKNNGDWIMYPVPVTNMLTLQYQGSKKNNRGCKCVYPKCDRLYNY